MKLVKKEIVQQSKRVFDISIKKNHNFIANGVVVHNCKPNTQDFISEVKPTCIEDLAAVTAIHRPGPLALHADKLYLNNRKNPEQIIYKHPLLKDILDKTCGLIIFQEQVLLIYHKLAGVPLEQTDGLRKALMKKDLSNKEKSIQQILKFRNEFIEKCKSVNDIDEVTSGEIFDEIEKFVAYSFNKGHSCGYCITTFMCSWLLTYYPNEWLAAYADYCATSKGKGPDGEDPKSTALTEIKRLGYLVSKPDINYSELTYNVKNINGQNHLVPSFMALKGVGKTAVYEMEQFRPYKTVEEILWNSDNTWRHSKFNKRALETLIKLGAFDSLDLVGEDKLFKSYKHMHDVIIGHYDELKRAIARKKNKNHKELLYKFIEEHGKLSGDWTPQEKIEFARNLTGSVDIESVMPADLLRELETRNILSIDGCISEEEMNCWAIVNKTTIAKTKTGKDYLKLQLFGKTGVIQNCFCWNYKIEKDSGKVNENDVIVGSFKNSKFGLSTSIFSIKKLT